MRRLVILAIFASFVFLVVSYLSPWSELNCWHEDFDLHSGRIRTQSYICFMRVSERIEDTAFSRAVTEGAAPPSWQRVNTFSPGVHYSPHFRYHGAITEIHWIEEIWEIGRFTPEARRLSGTRILQMWESSGGLYDVHNYVENVAKVALDNEEAQRVTTPVDLP